MKKIIIASLFLMFLSCTKDDETTKVNAFNYGDYTAKSMVSNIPIDANFDGNYSTDFLNEFLSYSTTARSTFKFYSLDNNKSGLSIILQTMQRWPLSYQDDTTNILRLVTFASISNTNREIFSFQPMLTTDGDLTDTKLIEFKIIDNNTIKLKFNHNLIYDVPSASWKTVIVEGIYEKND
jgi:hypothetical protein